MCYDYFFAQQTRIQDQGHLKMKSRGIEDWKIPFQEIWIFFWNTMQAYQT